MRLFFFLKKFLFCPCHSPPATAAAAHRRSLWKNFSSCPPPHAIDSHPHMTINLSPRKQPLLPVHLNVPCFVSTVTAGEGRCARIDAFVDHAPTLSPMALMRAKWSCRKRRLRTPPPPLWQWTGVSLCAFSIFELKGRDPPLSGPKHPCTIFSSTLSKISSALQVFPGVYVLKNVYRTYRTPPSLLLLTIDLQARYLRNPSFLPESPFRQLPLQK